MVWVPSYDTPLEFITSILANKTSKNINFYENLWLLQCVSLVKTVTPLKYPTQALALEMITFNLFCIFCDILWCSIIVSEGIFCTAILKILRTVVESTHL